MPAHAQRRPVGEFLAHVIERGAWRESERMATEIVERLAARAHRQFELASIGRQDVRGVAVQREVARHRELRQDVATVRSSVAHVLAHVTRRGVHGTRGYTIGWLGTASPPSA